MKPNILSITALIFGFGILSSFPEASASIAQQRLGQPEGVYSSVVAQGTDDSSWGQIQQRPKRLRRQQDANGRQLQLKQEFKQRRQNGVIERPRQGQQNLVIERPRPRQQNVIQLQQRQNIFERQRRQNAPERPRPRQQNVIQRQQQQNVLERQRRQNALERQRQPVQVRQRQRQQRDALERQRQLQNAQERERRQNALRGQQRERNAQRQRQRLQEQWKQQLADRRNREDRYNHRLAQQRFAWHRDRNRSRNSWLQQQRWIEQQRRLQRINSRHRNLYRNYVTYYNRDYWDDVTWRDRDYWNNRSFWSDSGYWYERDYWSQRGYIWDDVLGGILQGLLIGFGQGSIRSPFSPYRQASTLYDQGSQILSYNGLTQASCEPGNIVILLPNQQVMCALPSYSYVPGTYRVASPGLNLIPADIQY